MNQLEIHNELLKEELNILQQSFENYKKTIEIISQYNRSLIEKTKEQLLNSQEIVESYEHKLDDLNSQLSAKQAECKLAKEQLLETQDINNNLQIEVQQKNKQITQLVETFKICRTPNKSTMKTMKYRAKCKQVQKQLSESTKLNTYLRTLILQQPQSDKIVSYFRDRCDELERENTQLKLKKIAY